MLVHVVDCATYETGRDPLSDIMALEFELAEYTPALATDLAAKPRLVVLNKIDVPEARELAEFVRPDLEAAGHRVFAISAVTHEGLAELRFALAEVVAADRADKPTAAGAADRGPARRPSTPSSSRSSPIPRSTAASSSAAPGRNAGSCRPTSTTTRPSGTWPTGWPGSASRRTWPRTAHSPVLR